MSAYGSRQLDQLIQAFDDVAPKQPTLPTWQSLPTELRQGFLAVYSAGRRSALDEERRWQEKW